MHLKSILVLFAAPAILAVGSHAQLSTDSMMWVGGEPGPAMQTKTSTVSVKVDTMESAPVKGAPFCATVSTEHTQNLSDGNRIHTADSSLLCRDSEGRTRREAGLNLMGAAPQTSSPKLITIVDPVACVRYLLDSADKTAHKMEFMPGGPGLKRIVPDGPKAEHVFFMQRSGDAGPEMLTKDVFIRKDRGGDPSEPAPSSESLGDQTIEGIHATGTRVTTTIPAGKMGNEKPITVTSERWYSPELKVEVMTKHDDPWAGELKTEFKNVSTTEPDASLFAIPADYKIIDDKDGPMKMRLTIDEPPPAR